MLNLVHKQLIIQVLRRAIFFTFKTGEIEKAWHSSLPWITSYFSVTHQGSR
jgi:hypothetical protein